MRRLTLCAGMPLGVFAFWVCMVAAATRFPSEYDWRYMTISVLIYPERNPAGHLWASAALTACAVGGLLGIAVLSRKERTPGLYILATGYICMIASSSIRNGHQILAILGFISMCAGLVLAARRYLPLTPLIIVALLPIACAALTQAYLSCFRPELPWVGLLWRATGVPLYLSFALWEWVTCAVLSAYMTGIGVAAIWSS